MPTYKYNYDGFEVEVKDEDLSKFINHLIERANEYKMFARALHNSQVIATQAAKVMKEMERDL